MNQNPYKARGQKKLAIISVKAVMSNMQKHLENIQPPLPCPTSSLQLINPTGFWKRNEATGLKSGNWHHCSCKI